MSAFLEIGSALNFQCEGCRSRFSVRLDYSETLAEEQGLRFKTVEYCPFCSVKPIASYEVVFQARSPT